MPIFPFCMGESRLEKDQALHAQNCDGAHLNTQTAYMSSYNLTEEMSHVLPFCISHVMSLMSHVFAEQKGLL